MNIAVIGGDLRQSYLVRTLVMNGHNVKTFDIACRELVKDYNVVIADTLEQTLEDCEVVVLPTPVSERWIYVSEMLADDVVLFGWNIPKAFEHFKQYDFGHMDEVALRNAVATAEGTLAETIKYGSINLAGSKCLVIGYGRCAKEIAQRFRAIGAYVTVAARDKSQRDDAAFHGMDVSNMFERDNYSEYNFVINTVPARVLGKAEIDKLDREAVIIDIASVPGGTDFVYCKEQGITAIHSLGLPGKYSPKTSGEILGNAVVEVLVKL